jgi:WD40 repeat protein
VSVAWNNDGSKLATGSMDKTVKIWAVGSVGTFKCESTLGPSLSEDVGNLGMDGAHTVAWSPNGTMLASCSRRSHDIKLWDTQTGQVKTTRDTYTGQVQSHSDR